MFAINKHLCLAVLKSSADFDHAIASVGAGGATGASVAIATVVRGASVARVVGPTIDEKGEDTFDVWAAAWVGVLRRIFNCDCHGIDRLAGARAGDAGDDTGVGVQDQPRRQARRAKLKWTDTAGDAYLVNKWQALPCPRDWCWVAFVTWFEWVDDDFHNADAGRTSGVAIYFDHGWFPLTGPAGEGSFADGLIHA